MSPPQTAFAALLSWMMCRETPKATKGLWGSYWPVLAMAEKQRMNLSFSMAVPRQREAWKLLCAIPSGQRTDAVCRMILEHKNQTELLETVRIAIREELSSVQITSQIEKAEEQEAGSVSNDVLGFLLSLQEEGADTI